MMKNKSKLFGVIAIVAMLGFSMAACGDGAAGNDGGGNVSGGNTTTGGGGSGSGGGGGGGGSSGGGGGSSGGGGGGGNQPQLPRLTGTATITGTAMVGQTLTVNTSAVGGSGGNLSIQWRRGNTRITGATGGTYVLQPADAGRTVNVVVTRSGYSGNVTSAPTATVIGIVAGAAVTVTAPVTGQAPNSAARGSDHFTVSAVTWDPPHSPFQANTRYTARVTLTANANFTFTGGLTGSATINGNAATRAISGDGRTATLSYVFQPTTTNAPPALTGTVTISGTAQAGQTLTASVTGSNASPPFAFQWVRRTASGDINIGTNSSTYVVQAVDADSIILVTASHSNFAGNITSAPTAAVTLPPLPPGTAVSIGGTTQVGQTLTANINGPSGTGDPSFEWRAGGVVISTDSTLNLTTARIGQTITVTVTWSGNSGSVVSAAVGPVAASTVALTIGTPSSLSYSNNHLNRNALTPIENGAYTERTATFTVAVSGFASDSNAFNVGLAIQAVPGLSFTGHNATGNATSGTKTFTVTVTYNGTTDFATGTATINITGLTNLGTNYVHTGGGRSVTVNIIDGMATNRTIPVYQANIAHFNAYANTANGRSRHFRLMQNISLGTPSGWGNWTAIGSSGSPFTGSFDGQGHTISNLNIDVPGPFQGMFGVVSGSNAVVRNVRLLGGSVTASGFAGGIAGRVTNGGSVIDSFSGVDVIGRGSIGGVAGEVLSGGRIANSQATGNVRREGNFSAGQRHEAGGVAGEVSGSNSIIINSSATGNVSGLGFQGPPETYFGGVAGAVRDGGRIANSFSTGNVTGAATYKGGVAGGVSNGSIINSFSTGNVGQSHLPIEVLGGIAGKVENGSTITNSFAIGNVATATSPAFPTMFIFSIEVGGVAGRTMNSSITNSMALNPNLTMQGNVVGSLTVNLRRVANANPTSTLSGNYANSGMTAVGNFSFPANEFTATGRNGADVALATTRAQSWWTARGFMFGNTDDAPWRWCNVRQRPMLPGDNP